MGKKGAKSIYSDKQWEWVAERHREGYRLSELGEFLGMFPTSVHRRLAVRGLITPRVRDGLKPLKDRAKEFNSLGEE